MARLDPYKKQEWKAALAANKAAWVACGLDLGGDGGAAFEGMAGLIDWTLHGQVSALAIRRQIADGECCLVPGDASRGRPNYLFFPIRAATGAQGFIEKARKLNITDIAIAESTFPEDFLGKVKQTFKKEGIRFTKLEPSPE